MASFRQVKPGKCPRLVFAHSLTCAMGTGAKKARLYVHYLKDVGTGRLLKNV